MSKTDYDRNLFGEIERFIKLKIVDTEYEAPDKLELLRVFQFLDFTIDYARLCWNGSCHRCVIQFVGKKPGEICEALACRMKSFDQMHIEKLPSTIKPSEVAE